MKTYNRRFPFILFVAACVCTLWLAAPTHKTSAAETEAPKPATEATKAANAAVLQELPFGDKTSFELAHKGFIAPLPETTIKAARVT
jgi:linear primary-alkylsulfatase